MGMGAYQCVRQMRTHVELHHGPGVFREPEGFPGWGFRGLAVPLNIVISDAVGTWIP